MTNPQPATVTTFRELAERYPTRPCVGVAHGLADRFVAFVVGKPSTAQVAATARGAWGKLEAAVGALVPADDPSAELVGEARPVRRDHEQRTLW